MTEKRYIGFEIRRLDRMIGRSSDLITRPLMDSSMPAPAGWILGYLSRHSDEPIYQRDIEHRFCMPASTVTKILKQMEKDGYITRISVEDDARLKKIEVTPKGKALNQDIIETIHTRVDGGLLEGLSEQETEELFRLLDKVRENAAVLSGTRSEHGSKTKEKQGKW